MMRRSSRMLPLIGCSALLCFLFNITQADDIGTPIDSHGLQEVHHLSTLPPELAKALGWQGRDRDKIADLDREPGAPTPKSASRWFLLGGLSKTYALIVIDEGSAEHIHANSFSLTGNEWVSTDEWILNSRPYSVGELSRMLQSPQTQALTARWHKLQRDRDLQRRIATLDPNRYRSPTSLRDLDISDEEVLQIEAVVREIIPGAIVMISGVAKGCPCEDGPGCSAQVWIAVHLPKETRALEISDINDHWAIGPVQQWYLDSAELQRSKYPTSADYNAARDALSDRFPTCSIESSNAR
jgi:hypothetical protein